MYAAAVRPCSATHREPPPYSFDVFWQHFKTMRLKGKSDKQFGAIRKHVLHYKAPYKKNMMLT